MEKYDLYDNNRLPLGKSLTRGEDPAHGENRMVVHLCIFNSKGEMLIQQRVASKKLFPSLWDITLGGCAISNETSVMAVRREMKEEIGIDHDFSNSRPYFTINFNRGFDDWYIMHKDIDISTLTLQKEEVVCVKWASLDEILALLKDNKFIPYKPSFISALFDFKDGRGLY
ncbi:MAG: NUDIX domain-containing protein [Clostridia bacterium]|nr:NUDIX domain-containing protein [Clostridia bacterium]